MICTFFFFLRSKIKIDNGLDHLVMYFYLSEKNMIKRKEKWWHFEKK